MLLKNQYLDSFISPFQHDNLGAGCPILMHILHKYNWCTSEASASKSWALYGQNKLKGTCWFSVWARCMFTFGCSHHIRLFGAVPLLWRCLNMVLRVQAVVITVLDNHVSLAPRRVLGPRYTPVDYLGNEQPCTCLSRRRICEEIIEYRVKGQAKPLRDLTWTSSFVHKTVWVECPEKDYKSLKKKK